MTKTTVYLDERELSALKELAAKKRGVSAATLIREAVRDLLRKGAKPADFGFLKKHLKAKPSRTSFGDGVRHQRLMRKEWD